MKNILIFLILILTAFASNANEVLDNVSGKISEFAAGLIPGEGLTEVDVEFKGASEPTFTVLGVRDIQKNETSNYFTQFSLVNNDVGGDDRYTGNIGFGYRTLTVDESLMLGFNAFYDRDLTKKKHSRASFGIEAKASVLDFNVNRYMALTKRQAVNGTQEQSLGGIDYSLISQIPHMPWATFGYTGYKHYADKAVIDTDGEIYTLGMALSPTLQLDISSDQSNHEDGDVEAVNISFIYPPEDNKPTLADGFISDEIWHKESMKNKLSEKVKRNNNLTVEIQGAVIFTKK